MDRLLYVAMSGANMAMQAQAVNAQNLANLSTAGFKSDVPVFTSAIVEGPGYNSRVHVQTERTTVDVESGAIHATGRELDVAINGEGWFAVQAPDGSETYSRRGDLRFDALGVLTNGAGQPVLGNSGPLAVPPHAKLEVGSDGTISILPIGQNPNALAVVDRIKLVTLDASRLVKGEDGLLRLPEGEVALPDASVTVVSGALESSNVNGVAALVRMIELSRSFEMQIKMMKSAEENDRASAQIMKMT